MAKPKKDVAKVFISKSKKRGKHSKKGSVLKTSKNYKKSYNGQGR